MAPKLDSKIKKFFDLRKARLTLDKKAAEAKKKENKVRDDLILAMDKAGTDVAKGPAGSVSITRPDVPRVTDWLKLYVWIRKNNAFELLQRRINEGDFNERLAQSPRLAKNGIPGVEQVKIVKFHATAASVGKSMTEAQIRAHNKKLVKARK